MSTRGKWWMRDRPLIGWMVLATLFTAIHPFVPESRWIMVHLVTLGILTHAVMVWSIHFADSLLRMRADVESRTRKTWRLGMLQVGVVLVLVGVPFGARLWAVTIVGALLVSAAVVWHGYELLRRLRMALPGRFRVSVWHYVAAAACLPVGATFGAIMAPGLTGPWQSRLMVAHTMVNVLGFVGLTVLGTIVTLWPTMLRTRMAENAEKLSKRAFPLLGSGLVIMIAGPLIDSVIATLAGLMLYLVGALITGGAMVATARKKAPVTFPTLSAGAAFIWFVVGIVWLGISVAGSPSWAALAASYGGITTVFVVGFALQMVLGALTYLLPVVLGGGPTVMRAAMARIERWGVWRVTVANLGLLVCLFPVPSVVRVIASTLALVALALFIPLTMSGIKAAVRARRELAAAPPGERARPRLQPGEAKAQAEAAAPTFSRLQVLTGAATVALGAAVGVGIDPAAAGLARRSGGGGGGSTVPETGRTTRVTVSASGMRFHPATIDVPAGDRLVIDLTNDDATEVHDLVFTNAVSSGRLAPHASTSVDVGVIGADLEGWCSVVGHRQMGMVFAVRATGAPASENSGDHAAHQSSPTSESPTLDAMAKPSDDFTARDAVLPALTDAAGRTHRHTFTVTEVEQEVAPGIRAMRWTFNDLAPGPILHGRVGDRFEITLVNNGTMGHSIDFHAGRTAPDQMMRTIPPGESLLYTFTAERAGAWMYHCSTAPMSTHIAAGMHGVVVIEPEGLPRADREYVLVQSELFLGAQGAPIDTAKVAAEKPDIVAFNGYAWQYDHRPLPAKVGENVRIWLLNAGPNRSTAFHVVGGQFHTVWSEGTYRLRNGAGEITPNAAGTGGSQTLGLFASQGGFVELTFTEPGNYPFVSHMMVDAERGAKGHLAVT
ncbi:MAG: multicopper oxidase domain-containing protein [Dermatophilus congolensis]|nr:multicopper oxidase domain-containing protein [Dermatophilus congolensis]